MELFDSQAWRHLRCKEPDSRSAFSNRRQVKSRVTRRDQLQLGAPMNGMKVRLFSWCL